VSYSYAGFRRNCLSRGVHLCLPMCGIVHLSAPFGQFLHGFPLPFGVTQRLKVSLWPSTCLGTIFLRQVMQQASVKLRSVLTRLSNESLNWNKLGFPSSSLSRLGNKWLTASGCNRARDHVTARQTEDMYHLGQYVRTACTWRLSGDFSCREPLGFRPLRNVSENPGRRFPAINGAGLPTHLADSPLGRLKDKQAAQQRISLVVWPKEWGLVGSRRDRLTTLLARTIFPFAHQGAPRPREGTIPPELPTVLCSTSFLPE